MSCGFSLFGANPDAVYVEVAKKATKFGPQRYDAEILAAGLKQLLVLGRGNDKHGREPSVFGSVVKDALIGFANVHAQECNT